MRRSHTTTVSRLELTASRGSLTSHTATLEPTENSRSSLVIAESLATALKTSSWLTVPVLVHHHDGEQHAQLEEEDAIDVVRHRIADSDAEGEE